MCVCVCVIGMATSMHKCVIGMHQLGNQHNTPRQEVSASLLGVQKAAVLKVCVGCELKGAIILAKSIIFCWCP